MVFFVCMKVPESFIHFVEIVVHYLLYLACSFAKAASYLDSTIVWSIASLFAITCNAWCLKNGKFQKNFFKNLIAGYENFRIINLKEKKNMNIIMRGASTRFLITRLHDQIYAKGNSSFKKKNPMEFFNILKFHIKSYEGFDYFK